MDQEDYFGPNHRLVKELAPQDFEESSPWQLTPIFDRRFSKKRGRNGMVLFYAPWCGYCKKVKDNWIAAAKKAGFCDFYAFNCEKHKEHLEKIRVDIPHLVKSFPTIIIYENGSPSEYYQGDRSVKSFVNVCMALCADGDCRR